MKYVLLFVVVLVFAWRWRAARLGPVRKAKAKRGTPGEPLTMLPCAQCGVHIPAEDAIAGAQGVYCSNAHRLLRER